MQQYKTITKQIFFNYVIRAIDFALAFFLFIILTRFLTVSDFGVYSILNVTILLSTAILRLGLGEFFVRDTAGKKQKIQKFSVLFKFIFLVSALVIGLTMLFALNLSRFFNFQGALVPFRLALLITFFSVSITMITVGYFQSRKEMVKVTFFDFLMRTFWALPLLILVLFSPINLNNVFFLRALVVFIIFLFLLFFIKKNKDSFSVPLNKDYIKKGLIFGLPLATLTISQWVITASDRYILGYFHGSVKVSFYSYVYSLLNFILVLGYTISSVFYPYIVEAWNQRKKEKSNFLFNAYLKYSLMLGLPCTIGIFILRGEIVTMLSGPKYILALPIFSILLFFPLLDMGFTIYQRTLLIKNKTKKIAMIYGTGMILNIVLNFILIPRYHFYGAAVATICTYIVLFGLFFLEGHKNIRLDFSFLRIQNIVISTIIMGIIISFIHPATYVTKILTIILGAFIYTSTLFITKGFVKEELNFMKTLVNK